MSRFTPTAACVLAVALIAAVAIATGAAHAQQPTPTPTERQTSKITIRFVSNGEPVEVFFLNFPAGVWADGVGCLFPIIEGGGTQFPLAWPLFPKEGQPEECTKGPPTTVRVEFDGLFVEVLWTGADITADLEVPGDETTPTATPSPRALPETGASRSDGGSEATLLVASALAGVAVVLVGAAAFLYFGEKPHRLPN